MWLWLVLRLTREIANGWTCLTSEDFLALESQDAKSEKFAVASLIKKGDGLPAFANRTIAILWKICSAA